MPRIRALAAVLLLLALPGLAAADKGGTPAKPEDAKAGKTPATAKIGYIDLQKTLSDTKVGKKAQDKLAKEKKTSQKKLDDEQTAILKEYEDLKKQSQLLKPEALESKAKALNDRYVKLQETYVTLQKDLAEKEAKLTREIFDKAAPIIADIGKRDSYTMIVEKNEGAVLWADPGVDITAEVNKRLDAGEGGK